MSDTLLRFRPARCATYSACRARRSDARRSLTRLRNAALISFFGLCSAPALAENDLSGDVISGSPVVNFQPYETFRLRLAPAATPEPGAAALGFPTDLVFDANGRGYLAELTGDVRLIHPDGTVAATPVIDGTDYTDLPRGRDIGMTSVALHPDFLTPGTPGYGKIYTVESGIDHLQGIQNGDLAGVNRLDPGVADFAPLYKPVGIDERFKANTEHRSGVFEYTVDPGNLAAGFSQRREVLLTHQFHHAHNLGDLLFDPRAQPGDDGYGLLFVSSADSGNGTRYQNNANGPAGSPGPGSTLADDSVYGRILRIDPLDPNAPGVDLTDRAVFMGTDPANRNQTLAKFSVPINGQANPFFVNDGQVTGNDLTWAYGLRNPYRIFIDPEEPTNTTTIWASETGQQNVESVRTVQAGSDGGWGMLEGGFFYLQNSDNDTATPTLIQGLSESQLQNTQITVAPPTGVTTRSLGDPEIARILQVDFPEFQYDHTDGVSPMGGMIYRGGDMTPLQGMYLFAEYQGSSDSMLTDPDGRTIGDQAVILVADPDDPLGQVYAMSTTLDSPDVPERILGFATAPDGEALLFGFNFGPAGPEGVVYRMIRVRTVIPEPSTGVLALVTLSWIETERRRGQA